ncbi:MAG TPA: MMPL family transporter [Solirubrobacteraceae bacterium]|jgi:RND superfamily putative drug exporter|nr:MMPL family transporter [Solirubrobacteraceae bacterium]
MLTKLATFVHAHGRRVLLVAVLGAAIAGAFGFGVEKHMSPYGANDPATQSVQAANRFEAAAHRKIEPGVVAIVSDGDVARPDVRRRVEQVAGELRAEPDVASAVSFYETHDPATVSRDRRSTYVIAYFKPRSDRQLKDAAQRIENHFAGAQDVRLGGQQVADAQANTQVGHDLAHAELLAFPFIFLLSLLFFRSLVAALLPPLLGGLAIVATFFVLRIVSGLADLSVFGLNLVTGLGLGLAIDYSLFMVSRYREESVISGFGVETLRRTLQTAGRTVLFSSVTVAAAIASLAIFPQRFLYSMGIAGAIVAVVAAALALVVLPALLTVLGPRVNALAPKRLQRAADRDARPAKSGAWYRLAQLVMRRPGRIAAVSATLLIALGIPFTGIKFLTANASVLPRSASARQVDEALARDFPPNRTSPVEVVVGASAGSSQVQSISARISRLPDVSAVARAQPAGANDALLGVASIRRPLSDSTKQLVRDIRAIRAPVYIGVAGQTAAFLDLEHSLGAHLPAVLAVIIAATLIVLFLFTGSVILPFKAVLMNMLNLSAVLGILVLIFQDGRLQGLLSYSSQGALDATQPIVLAAVAFGLATDYGVFLLSRIKEARDSGVSDSEAVAVGLERTGRIITAAAVLFAAAIGAFATSKLVFIKELGVGTALAVLIDASIIRALLVPSLMELLGSWNWWAPRPLRRLHDRIGLHESGPTAIKAPRSEPASATAAARS